MAIESEAQSAIPVIFCIDVEPDGFFIDPKRKAPWKGYENLVPYIRELRRRIEHFTGNGANFSWFFRLDPQVEVTYGSPDWPLVHYEALTKTLAAEGDAFGIHPHPYRWAADSSRWILAQGDIPWVQHCTVMCYESFRRVLGTAPRYIRYGDRWQSNEGVRIAEDLKIPFDLTLEPGHARKDPNHKGHEFDGELPDTITAPDYPYRPALHDFRKPDGNREGGLWMIPVSTGSHRRPRPAWKNLLLRLVNSDKLKGRPYTMNLYLPPPIVQQMTEELLDKRGLPYLCLTLRTDVGAAPAYFQNLKDSMDYLLRLPVSRQFRFVKPDEALKLLGLI